MPSEPRIPQDAVFSIPELLEQILLYTDLAPIPLLNARLINRTANAIILSARHFRRVLFLDATPSNPILDSTAQIEINPLLEKMFPPFMQSQFKRIRRRAEAETAAALGYFGCAEASASETTFSPSCSAASTVLPSIECANRCRGRDFRWACLGGAYSGPCLHLPVVGWRGGEEHLNEVGEGIWRAMYASRPAIVVHAVEVGACGGVEHVWEVDVGMRMGEVMDALVFGKKTLSGKREVERVPVE